MTDTESTLTPELRTRMRRLANLGDQVCMNAIIAIVSGRTEEGTRQSERLRTIRLALEADMRKAGILP